MEESYDSIFELIILLLIPVSIFIMFFWYAATFMFFDQIFIDSASDIGNKKED